MRGEDAGGQWCQQRRVLAGCGKRKRADGREHVREHGIAAPIVVLLNRRVARSGKEKEPRIGQRTIHSETCERGTNASQKNLSRSSTTEDETGNQCLIARACIAAHGEVQEPAVAVRAEPADTGAS